MKTNINAILQTYVNDISRGGGSAGYTTIENRIKDFTEGMDYQGHKVSDIIIGLLKNQEYTCDETCGYEDCSFKVFE